MVTVAHGYDNRNPTTILRHNIEFQLYYENLQRLPRPSNLYLLLLHGRNQKNGGRTHVVLQYDYQLYYQ